MALSADAPAAISLRLCCVIATLTTDIDQLRSVIKSDPDFAEDGARGCRQKSPPTQRKTPGSFLPGVLLESYQTIGIRSYAERER